MCAICTSGQMYTWVLICSTEFAPPTKVKQIYRLHDQNTHQVQIYTLGVYLYRGDYCEYKLGFSDCSLYVDDFCIFYRLKSMRRIERQLLQNLNKVENWA